MNRIRDRTVGRVLPRARRSVKEVTKRLGIYDCIIAAIENRDPGAGHMRRNERDDRHLTAILAASLQPDANAIDVGAHSGGVLTNIVRLAPLGKHVAFEPIPSLAERLAREYPAVTVYAAAASDRRGTATFQWIESEQALSGLRLASNYTVDSSPIEVQLERLDDVVNVPPAFVKIDVEGGEEAVLRGAQDTLGRYKPLVVIEHGLAAAAYGTTPEVIYDLLAAPRLRVFDMDGRGPFSRDEFVDIVGVGEHFNFIAR